MIQCINCFLTLSLSSYVYKCVCQQHSELLYSDLTTKIANHLQQVSSSLEVSICKSTKSLLWYCKSSIFLPFCFSGQPTRVLNWKLQRCFHTIHSLSSVYSSRVYVLGTHPFIYVFSANVPVARFIFNIFFNLHLKSFRTSFTLNQNLIET